MEEVDLSFLFKPEIFSVKKPFRPTSRLRDPRLYYRVYSMIRYICDQVRMYNMLVYTSIPVTIVQVFRRLVEHMTNLTTSPPTMHIRSI